MAKPLLLSDNFFDDVILHPEHVVAAAGGEVAGAEVFRIADNLRDVTRFAVATPDAYTGPLVDCGVVRQASCLVLDRGHNLAGRPVFLLASATGTYIGNGDYDTVLVANIPAAPGGRPSDPGGCLTPEGVWWKTFPATASRWWFLDVPPLGPGLAPVLTGVYLGDAYRLPEYLDAPAAYDYRLNLRVGKNKTSRRGVRVKRHIIGYAEMDLRLRLEEPDYLALHPHVRRLTLANHPWWVCPDDATDEGAALMRLFHLPGETVYDPAASPVVRDVRLLLEEVAPLAVL